MRQIVELCRDKKVSLEFRATESGTYFDVVVTHTRHEAVRSVRTQVVSAGISRMLANDNVEGTLWPLIINAVRRVTE